jgi:hypothetical protein
MITGYEAFGIYQSLRLHFTTEQYDFFKYNGKSNVSVNAFENRKDKYYFYKLSRKFNNKKDLIEFISYNLIEDEKVWVGSLLEEQAEIHCMKHQKIIQSLSYNFKNECNAIFGNSTDPNSHLEVVNGEYPDLLKRMLHKELSLESLCIMNKIFNFVPRWDKKIDETIRWPQIKRTILKYSPFIEFDIEKYKKILKECVNVN